MPEGEGTTRTLETPEPGENEWGDEDDALRTESGSEEPEEEESTSSNEEIEDGIGDKGDAESGGNIISGTESISDGEGTVKDSDIKDDNASEFVRSIRMKPFFGPDTKYGYCPYCAAVIIFNERVISLNNDGNTVKCHNCEAKLEVEM